VTLMLDVTPELQQRLQEEAFQRGIAAEEYARLLLEERLLRGPMKPGQPTPAERMQRLRRWIENNRGLPPLSDEAFRRASFYGERS
jgi:hypothetical protein